jgi:hypothetical protein
MNWLTIQLQNIEIDWVDLVVRAGVPTVLLLLIVWGVIYKLAPPIITSYQRQQARQEELIDKSMQALKSGNEAMADIVREERQARAVEADKFLSSLAVQQQHLTEITRTQIEIRNTLQEISKGK